MSVYPDDCDDTETLLRNADIAMFGTKAAGKGGFQYYSQQLDGEGRESISEEDLMYALENDQFELYYQPIQDAQSEGVALAEVLLRWNNREKGLLDAGTFVPIAEKTGFIIPLSEWVLHKACERKRGRHCAERPGHGS